jgi:hypothetical protein
MTGEGTSILGFGGVATLAILLSSETEASTLALGLEAEKEGEHFAA